jgi:hypothetical protein
MKKLMIIIIMVLVLGTTASAQKNFNRISWTFWKRRLVVGAHIPVYHYFYYRPWYRPLYYHHPYFYYDPFFAGYYAPPYPDYYRPSKLHMEIADIKHDYDEKIESARNDKSLTGKERRKQVRELKHERDHAIEDAERNYYKQ